MKKIILLSLLVFNGEFLYAQLSSSDYSLLGKTSYYSAKDFSYYKGNGNSADIMKTKNKSAIARYNPFSLTLKGTMWLYQNVISPQLSSPCPYKITCSNFAKDCIEQYGIVKGVALAADRLMRDNRISIMDIPPLDIDPKTNHILDNPDRYKWRP